MSKADYRSLGRALPFTIHIGRVAGANTLQTDASFRAASSSRANLTDGSDLRHPKLASCVNARE